MYGDWSDGESDDRKTPPAASSMLWVRNLRRYVGSGSGLGSEPLMELETKRILLDIFKEKQPKSGKSGTIPTFYKKKPEQGSITSTARLVYATREGVYKSRMELHQGSEEEDVTDTEEAENWFSLTCARHICDVFVALDKDMNGSLSKEELCEYADGTLTDIFIERVFDEHVLQGEMDFESFLDFVLALENKDTPEGLTYLFRCLDLRGRGHLTTADVHTLFRDVHQKWIEGGNYELCIEDVQDEIWDMVKPVDPLMITLQDLLGCKQGGTVVSMLIDVRGFWAHDNRENLLQQEEEPEEEQ